MKKSREKLTKTEEILKNPATTKKDAPNIRKLKHHARRLSIKEGLFASTKNAFGDYYISPFAIAINASNSIIAMLTSIVGILGPLSQIFGSRLVEKYSRKKIISKAVFLESLIWIPLIIISFLFYKGLIVNLLPLTTLLIFSFYVIFTNIGHPAWFSWMGDIVDEKYRGRWFSKRNLLNGFVLVVLAISASFFLDYAKKTGMQIFGFMILFSLAFIARLTCWRILKKQYEPKIELEKGYYFSFWNFLLNKNKENNLKKFSIYRLFLNLSCAISSPLLAVYLLRFLEFKYSIYMIVTFAGTVFSLTVLGLWGKFADEYGNYKVLAISSVLIPVIPFLWILNSNPVYLVLVPALISGVSWAGFNLSASNFIYDNVSSQKRSLVVSYHNMLAGLGTFMGAGIGAILIKFLTIQIIQPIVLIFIISTIARMIVVFYGIPQINEVRKTTKFDGTKSLKNLILTQTKPTIIEEIHQIMAIKKYLHEK